ncbi:hypothetical protein AALO_G00172800 [Alosa alosa]|uniref:Uncharacterized protein n=1 Tax=Alosa alosa TaxID=278164 RepID=A0AAV6GBR1_9TELE|nr:hypothetical protein AALO_G00172800 [Alosa alosa]
MTMTMPETISVITVLLSVISSLHATPLASSCKAAVQPDGSFVFQLGLDSTTLSDCEPQIIVGEKKKVCAVYEGGKVPASWLPPVLGATMFNFTSSSCRDVKIGLDCPLLLHYKYLPCSCDSSSSMAQTSSSTARPLASVSNSAEALHDKSPFPVGAVIGCSVFVVIITLAFIVFRCRKRINKEPTKASRSASNSNEDLVGPLNP